MSTIRVIVPISGLTPSALEERRQRMQSLAGDREILLEVLDGAPPSIETAADEAIAAGLVVCALQRIIETRPDACVIWCAGDPGARAGRGIVAYPVIGPGEAAMRLAGIVAARFGAILPLHHERAGYRAQARANGMEASLVDTAALGIPVLDLRKNADRTQMLILEAARPLVERGAEAIVLNCMALAGFARRAEAELGVPVIDPAEAAFSIAKLCIDDGYSFSPITFPPLNSQQ